MEAKQIGLASARQREFLERLCKRTGVSLEKAMETMTSQEASVMIDELLAGENGGKPVGGNGQAISRRQDSWSKRSDEVKLGLATKLVYARWGDGILGITKSKTLRQVFIDEVIQTHKVFREIDSMVETMNKGGDSDA